MFGECHAHIIMDGRNFRHAIDLHKEKVNTAVIHTHFQAYQDRGIAFVRDGGDNRGVSSAAKEIAPEYGIDYRTPAFAIHRKGYYGGIVGFGYETMAEYHSLVRKAASLHCDFIKIMISGIMDFAHAGVLSCPSLPAEEIREMIHIAHEEGFAVMAHANGADAVSAAARYGVDSIEHGNFIDNDCLTIMAENQTVYVPTISTIANLIGCGRFPNKEVAKILLFAFRNVRIAYEKGVPLATGSDAGAYMVPHGVGVETETKLFYDILGNSPEVTSYLQQGEQTIQTKFRRT